MRRGIIVVGAPLGSRGVILWGYTLGYALALLSRFYMAYYPLGGLHDMHRLWLADPPVCLVFAWSVRPWRSHHKTIVQTAPFWCRSFLLLPLFNIAFQPLRLFAVLNSTKPVTYINVIIFPFYFLNTQFNEAGPVLIAAI